MIAFADRASKRLNIERYRRMRPILLPVIAIPLASALIAGSAVADPYPAVQELWRLGPGERLAINRGGPVRDAGDVNGDNLADLVIATNQGSVRIVYGPATGDVNGVIDTSIQGGVGGFGIGGSFSRAGGGGDMNGDGLNDMVAASDTSVHVVFGRAEGFPSTVTPESLNGVNGFEVRSGANSVAIVPDVNGDGFDDLVIGKGSRDTPTVRDGGRVIVVFGRRDGFPASMHPFNLHGDNGLVLYGEETTGLLGLNVDTAGDFNNDGIADIALGAPDEEPDGLERAGRVYVVPGRSSWPAVSDPSTLSASDGLILEADRRIADLGRSVRSAGDVNADGFSDLIAGAPGKANEPNAFAGRAYVVYGGPQRSTGRLSVADIGDGMGATLLGIRAGSEPPLDGIQNWGDQAGYSVAGIGDFNGDGVHDVAIGAPYTIITETRRGNGEVYVVYGQQGGLATRLPLGELNGNNGFRLLGQGSTDYTGTWVSPARDFNADGIDDLLFGAPGRGQNESYVLYGKR